MTIPIALDELYRIIKDLQPDTEGFVPTNPFLAKASEFFGCTELTVRNFVNKNSSFFDLKHGLISMKKIDTTHEQIVDADNYEVWLSDREAVLNECLEFLKIQTPSPYVENILVQAASARDELHAFSDSKLASFLMTLKRDFNFSPTKTLSGSM